MGKEKDAPGAVKKYKLEDLFKFGSLEYSPTPQTLANDFFQYRNENFASGWLAGMLDPSRAKTTELLIKLLEMLKLPEIPNLTDVVIKREYDLGENGRVDIVIKTNEMLIMLENKIDQNLGDNQAEKYLKALDSEIEAAGDELKNELYKVVVLHLEKNALPKTLDSRIIDITHEDLVKKFKEISIDFSENLRTAFYLKEYISYMESLQEKFELPKELGKYDLKSFNEITNAIVGLKKAADKIGKYVQQRVEGIVEDGWKTGGSGYYVELKKISWKTDKADVHYELFDVRRVANTEIPTSRFVFSLHDGKFHEIKDDDIGNKFKAFVRGVNKDKDYVDMDYSDNISFEASVNQMVYVLKELKNNFSCEVDKYVAKK